MSLEFYRLWLRRPLSLGAIAPSGDALASAMVDELPLAPLPVAGPVVELGAGTGSITRAILRAGVAPGDLIVLEREPSLCRILETRYPGVDVVRADAEDLRAVLASRGAARAGAIISGLPLLSLDATARRRILEASFESLVDGGRYLQFTYGPKAPIPQRLRADLGIEGKRLKWVLLNLPPAAVWCFRHGTARRPVGSGEGYSAVYAGSR